MPADRAALIRTARLYGDAVAIVDPLRMRLWTEYGLTLPQLRLLFMLREQPGSTGGALAGRFSVHPSTITGHLEKLLQRAMVRREEDGADHRIQHLYLTEQGVELLGQSEHVAGQFLIGVLERLSPRQLHRLTAGLADLLTAAEQSMAGAVTPPDDTSQNDALHGRAVALTNEAL